MTTDRFIPPAAESLPEGALDSATEGANRLDAWALDPRGRNFLAHALVQLARDGWLRTAPAAVPVPPPADQTARRDRIAEAVRRVPIKYGAGPDAYTIQPVSIEEADVIAAAVEAVLPPDDRAATLREATDVAVRAARGCGDSEAGQYAASVAASIGKELRRMADADAVLAVLPEQADRAALLRAHAALAEQAGRTQVALARVRRLHDALEAETPLTSPDNEITRGAAARKIAAALDGWTDPAELRRVAAEEQPAETPMFGSPDCTCIPFTRQGGKPRYCGPTDTVDMISGWEIGRDCPHHKPAVGEQPETQEAYPPYSEYRVENYDAGAWQVIGLKRKTLADAQEVRDRFRRGYPDARLRIIRRDESVAVVETDPEPAP